MKRLHATWLLLALSWAGCTGCNPDDPETTPEDTSTPDGDDDMSDILGTLPPLPTPTAVPNPLTSVTVWPSGATLEVGGSVTCILEATLRDGTALEAPAISWQSDHPEVAAVDASGVISALASGSAVVTASVEDLVSEPILVEVLEPGILEVVVIDAATRDPLPDSLVFLGSESVTSYTTDANGEIRVEELEPLGAVTVTATHDDYFYTSILDTTSRRIILPLRKKESLLEGTFQGETNFSGMGFLNPTDIRLGIITRSFFGNPLSLNVETIIGEMREVNVCNYPIDLPSNVVGKAAECDVSILDYSVPAESGIYDAFMLAGDLPLEDLFKWLSDDPNLFTNLGSLLMLIPNLYEFGYAFVEDVAVEAPYTTDDVTVSPGGVSNVPMTVRVPKAPSGIAADYPPIVFATADMGDRGMLPIGLAGSDFSQNATVYFPEELRDRKIVGMVLASELGVGNDGAYVAVMADRVDSLTTVRPPDFLDLLQPEDFEYNDQSFSYYQVTGADVYRATFTYRFKKKTGDGGTLREYFYWDIFQGIDASGPVATTRLPDLPNAPPSLYSGWDYYQQDWEFQAYDTGDLSFDVFTLDPTLNVFDSTVLLERISRNKIYKVEEQ